MLETKIADRLKELQAATSAATQQAEAATLQAKQDFEANTQQLTDLATAIGVTGQITTPAHGESTVPYASFLVAGVDAAIELRDGIINLLVHGQPVAANAGYFSEADVLQAEVERVLVDAIAQHALEGGAVSFATEATSTETTAKDT